MNNSTRRIESLLRNGDWESARKAISRELVRAPDDHWLRTQLGVTLYEQGKYEESLKPLLDSLKLVGDCPLTLWNLAGALDALGKPDIAVSIYTWLLQSTVSPKDDECWESDDWADSLKTDCVYRVGACFQKMKRWASAENCFRQYVNLLLAGMSGTYSLDDAARHIHELQGHGRPRPENGVRDAIASTLQDSGVKSVRGKRRKLPKLELADLLAT